MKEFGNPFVSVIIPNFNDWERLGLCLLALSIQTYPQENFEIVIVNNDVETTVPKDFVMPENCTLLHEPKPGSYACRNKGLDLAKGSVVGFTDSDCIPDPSWIENAVKSIDNLKVDRVGGKVAIFYKDINNKTWAELYEAVFAFNQKRNVEILKASITANLFVKRSCFEIVGRFDSEKKSGEDFGWSRRANVVGLSLIYADNVIVRHPARVSLTELAIKRRRVLGGKTSSKLSAKSFIIPGIIFYNYFIMQMIRLIKSKDLNWSSKVKVSFVILYLFFVTEFEYFRILLGGQTHR